MTDFATALADTANLHRRSDLENLANAHNDLDEFVRDVVDPLRAEIVRIAEAEHWPEEGIVWDVYRRVQNLTRGGDPERVVTSSKPFEPKIPYRL